MSDLQKSKEKYYNWKKEADDYFDGVVPEIGDYICELEILAKESIEALTDDFKILFEIWDKGAQEHHYDFLESLLNKRQKFIEKATGLKIEEILKDA